MFMTLDEYLAEVDHWKQPVVDAIQDMSPEQRVVHDRASREWLQAKVGSALRESESGLPIRQAGRGGE
jgi:hypothetical protein